MVNFGPAWFLGVDVIFEFIFTLITFAVAAYSYRFAKIARSNNYYHLAAGFLLLSAGYGVRTLFNFLIYLGLIEHTGSFSIDWLHFAGFYMSSALLLGGLILILSTTFKTRDIRPTILLYLTSIIAFFLSFNRPVLFFFLSITFLSMIVYNHFKIFWEKGRGITFLVLIAFTLVLLGQFNLLFRFSPLFYVMGHSAELLGYFTLLIALIRMIRK